MFKKLKTQLKDNKKKGINNRRGGFTLIEILIVLVVVGLLMVLIFPNITNQQAKIDEKAKENLTEIVENQIKTYELAEGSSPTSTDDLINGGYLSQKQVDQAIKYDIELPPAPAPTP